MRRLSPPRFCADHSRSRHNRNFNLPRRKCLCDDAPAADVNEPCLQPIALEETAVLRNPKRNAGAANTAIDDLQLLFLGGVGKWCAADEQQQRQRIQKIVQPVHLPSPPSCLHSVRSTTSSTLRLAALGLMPISTMSFMMDRTPGTVGQILRGKSSTRSP